MISTDNKDLILKFLNSIRTDAVSDLHEKNISQGDLAMKAEADEDQGQLTGADYWYFTVYGRRPGKQPPIESILGWLKKKGITSDIPERSLAFLIARKIGRLGTDIYLGKRPGLALPQIIEAHEEKFEQDAGDKIQLELGDQIEDTLRQVFKSSVALLLAITLLLGCQDPPIHPRCPEKRIVQPVPKP